MALAFALGAAARADEPQERQLAQTIAESTMRAAAQRGVTVCRQLQVGIAERDWIRGEVIEARRDAIAVRIEEPGRFPHILKEVPIVPGAVLWNEPALWTPCV